MAMTPDQIFEAMDTTKQYAELLGGIKRQLVEEQGFDDAIAQMLVLEMIKGSVQKKSED